MIKASVGDGAEKQSLSFPAGGKGTWYSLSGGQFGNRYQKSQNCAYPKILQFNFLRLAPQGNNCGWLQSLAAVMLMQH